MKQPSILDALSKPAAAKKSTAAKPQTSSDSGNSDPAPAAKKAAAARKRKTVLSSDESDSDSDGGNLMARLKGKAAAAGKVRLGITRYNHFTGGYLTCASYSSHNPRNSVCDVASNNH